VKATGAVLAGLALTVAVACFSDRTAGPSTSVAACRVPVTVIDSMHYLVAIRDFAYSPDSLAVPQGATVSWVNCEDAGTEPHTATSDTSGVFDSSLLVAGAHYSHQFTGTGAFPYFCTEHSYMTGKIVVQ
jgi:plastocyanin